VAGALVGLLFVAVSVTAERLAKEGESQLHRVRASAALTSFSNALVVCTFGLIPGVGVGWPAVSSGILGLMFVGASVLSLWRLRGKHHAAPREAFFLIGQTVALGFEVAGGLGARGDHPGIGAIRTVAIIVVVNFVIGIARAWELIGGPEIGLFHELRLLGRRDPDGGA
jgi:hypothetical protein